MAAVERHLAACESCCRLALAAPDDRLAALVRMPGPGPVACRIDGD